MATMKDAIETGLTLVARYKSEQHTCEVVEHDGRLFFVLSKGEVCTSPSAAGKAITGTATNGYRFWSIPDEAPSGQQKRQQAAQKAVVALTTDAAPRTERGAAAEGKPAALIERAKSQRGVPESQARYFCSSCMSAFEAQDAGRGKVPERCPQGHSALDAA